MSLLDLLIVLLDNLLDLGDPCLLQVVGSLRYRGCLDLVEVVHFDRVSDVGVENVSLGHIVALLADVLLGTDDLILDLKCLKAVLRESFGEGVTGLRNADHTEVWGGALLLGGRQVELTSDQVGALFVEMLVKDDVVHRLGEVAIDLVEKRGRVGGGLATERLRVLGHGENAVHLVVVNLRDLVLWHVLNVVVVLDESVSIDSVVIGALEALNKLAVAFLVEDDENARQAALNLRHLPDTLEALRLGQVLEQAKLAPVTELVLVLPETVGTDTIS